MSWPDDYTLAILGGCAQRVSDAARAAVPHVRTGLRRFREAVGSSSLTVGPVSVSLVPPARAPSRIVAGHVATKPAPGAS